jgi:protein gp37
MVRHGTAIEWTHLPGYKGETWNPHGGCSKVSEGCRNCYALRQANRFKDRWPHYRHTIKNGNWTGHLNRISEPRFYKPIHWRDPRAIFVSSMSDFFHEGADGWRETLWHTIYDTPQHLYLILTKRPERIPDCLPSFGKKEWPWPHVWLGATVENQEMADKRVPELLRVPAAKRFLSLEPLLGPVSLSQQWVDYLAGWDTEPEHDSYCDGSCRAGNCPVPVQIHTEKIDWVVCGGESGPGARPMDVEWAESILRQCRAHGVPFFMKQMAKRAPIPKHLMVREFPL